MHPRPWLLQQTWAETHELLPPRSTEREQIRSGLRSGLRSSACGVIACHAPGLTRSLLQLGMTLGMTLVFSPTLTLGTCVVVHLVFIRLAGRGTSGGGALVLRQVFHEHSLVRVRHFCGIDSPDGPKE